MLYFYFKLENIQILNWIEILILTPKFQMKTKNIQI